MEVAPKSVSPQIQRVLKSFQTSANRTLQGPGRVGLLQFNHDYLDMAKLSPDEYRNILAVKTKVEVEHMFRVPTPFPIQQMPVFTPVDASRSEKTETVLEGEKIACFLVGGEKRLCLPQILNTALKDYSLQEINTVCDELHIFCSRCQPEQLEILKVSGILPPSAASCGLITKTDAERLCNALIHLSNDNAPSHPSPNSFKVYHECFGKCKGVFNPEAYTHPDRQCIQCVDCGRWFTPQKFVCHSHKALENRTCHWGFDSANWRHYLLLAKHQQGLDKLQDALEELKNRFESGTKNKRKQTGGEASDRENGKRLKSQEESATSTSPSSPWTTESSHSSPLRAIGQMSAFQPWSPATTQSANSKDGKVLPAPPAIMREQFAGTAPSYLHSGPPVLLHPDKVVPHSESSRYEPNYAPNVSLAPVQKCKGEDDEEEEEEEEDTKCEKSETSVPETVVPKPGPSKGYNEWEILSESDDSSAERSSPSQGDDASTRLSPLSDDQRALEIEQEMIRQALDGKIGETKEEKDRFLHEFCKLRAKHVEMLNKNVQARRQLKMELAHTKSATSKKLQEVADKNSVIEKELNKLRQESELRIKDMHCDKEKLLNDVKALRERDDQEIGKLLQINQDLQARLAHYELVFDQIRVENLIMQDKLLQMGVNIMDLIKANYNGKVVRGASRSPPQRSPTDNGSPRHSVYPLTPHGVMQSHSVLEMFVKKEREGNS